jgi:hypothetical protein
MSLKKTFYQTTYTAIPSHIPRQLGIDLLQNHSEIIELNPLVIGHQAIKAPPKAPADEYYSTWYDIQQRIQLIPGTGKVGASKISFHGVFHDLPNGLQTHVYAPGGIDLRHKYSIQGNQPGEPPQPKELGSGAPTSGLYLKQEVEIRCNIMMISFVKKELKSATDVLIARLVKKAELVDAGILHAMMDQGKLTTVNPANRSSTIPLASPGLASGFPSSPRLSQAPYQSPRLPSENGSFAGELAGPQGGVRQSQYGSQHGSQHGSQRGSQYGSQYGQPSPSGLGFELPADNTYPAQQQQGYSHHSGSQASDRGSYFEASGNSAQHSQPSQSAKSFVYEMSGESAPSQQHANMDARSYGNLPVQRSPSLQPRPPAEQSGYGNSAPGQSAYGNPSPHGVNQLQSNHPAEPNLNSAADQSGYGNSSPHGNHLPQYNAPVDQSSNRNSAMGQPTYGSAPQHGNNQLQPNHPVDQPNNRNSATSQLAYGNAPPHGTNQVQHNIPMDQSNNRNSAVGQHPYGAPPPHGVQQPHPNAPGDQAAYRGASAEQSAYGNVKPPLHGVNQLQPNHPAEQSTYRGASAEQATYGNPPPQGVQPIHPQHSPQPTGPRQPGMEERAPGENPNNQTSQRPTGFDRIKQVARKSSWEPDDDSKRAGG